MSSTKQPEMGVSLTTSFHKPSHAPPTPPLSPQTHGKELKRQTSRFRLPKILRRAHTSDSVSTAAPAAIQPSSSTVSTFSKCSTQDDPSDRAYPGVYGTKQPIPGPMPVVQMSVAKDDSLTRTMSKKLRKMPKSYQNLRAFKSDIQPNSELTKTSIRVPALLPSPLPSDEEGRSREGFCAFQNPRGAVATKANDVQPSYEDEGIVAGYCEDVFEDNIRSFGITSAVPRGRKQNSAVPSEPQESPHDSGDIRTPPKSNMSATLRSPKRDRSSSLSSEATWLSPSFARQDTSICMSQLERIQMNEKRLAEKARRCCHLVEGPEVDLPASWSGERKAVSPSETC